MKSNKEFLKELNIIYKQYPFLKENNSNISYELLKLNEFLNKHIFEENIRKF
tara:strand:+ start:8494 stop:8649 length:156 start_codon:yes stop_codon:yes gene_type:complete